MPPASDLDGIDFKPFFDMVVGVLFVLLILIGALLFFEQAQQVDEAVQKSQAQKIEWRAQEAQFLARLSEHLRARDIDAETDVANNSIVIPLDAIAQLDRDGLPEIRTAKANALGSTLAQDIRCVSSPKDTGRECGSFLLLHLNEAVSRVAIARLQPDATLTQDRFGNLLASLYSAALLGGTPDLLRLSSDAGTMLFRSESAVTTTQPAPSMVIGGDLTITFSFREP